MNDTVQRKPVVTYPLPAQQYSKSRETKIITFVENI